jgi:hypothetical protein
MSSAHVCLWNVQVVPTTQLSLDHDAACAASRSAAGLFWPVHICSQDAADENCQPNLPP